MAVMLQMHKCLELFMVDGVRGEGQGRLAAGAFCLTTESFAAAHPFLSLALLVLEPMSAHQYHRSQHQSRWKNQLQLESLQCLEQGEERCLVGLALLGVDELHPLQIPAGSSCFGLVRPTKLTSAAFAHPDCLLLCTT